MQLKQSAFTLIEVLLTMVIVTILVSIVLVAVNPSKQIGTSQNSQRKVDINTIANAVYQYASDNNGSLPSAITTTQTEICKTGAASCTGLINLSVLTTNETYLISIPVDPNYTSANSTGYSISRNAQGRITVTAPHAENGESISVRR